MTLLTQQRNWTIVASITGVFVVAVILFTVSPAPAETTISWNPPTTTVTISPGGETVVPLSFTSSKNVSNVKVRVVSELETLIQVDPATFPELEAGQAVELFLIVSVDQDATFGTFDGTIQLRYASSKKSKTFSKPLPIVVNVWQSFVSDLGIIVRYPPQYQTEITQDSEGNTIDLWESLLNLSEGLPPSFTVVVLDIDLGSETLEAFATRTLGPLATIGGTFNGFLEVSEPSIGEGLFHHFIYLIDRKLLIDIIARTANHDEDTDFLEILQSLEY